MTSKENILISLAEKILNEDIKVNLEKNFRQSLKDINYI